MTENYITTKEAVEKYGLNLSRLQSAIGNFRKNGLYKVIHRKRTRLFFREDYLEAWLKTNDVITPPIVRGSKPIEPKPRPKPGKRRLPKGNW